MKNFELFSLYSSLEAIEMRITELEEEAEKIREQIEIYNSKEKSGGG